VVLYNDLTSHNSHTHENSTMKEKYKNYVYYSDIFFHIKISVDKTLVLQLNDLAFNFCIINLLLNFFKLVQILDRLPVYNTDIKESN